MIPLGNYQYNRHADKRGANVMKEAFSMTFFVRWVGAHCLAFTACLTISAVLYCQAHKRNTQQWAEWLETLRILWFLFFLYFYKKFITRLSLLWCWPCRCATSKRRARLSSDIIRNIASRTISHTYDNQSMELYNCSSTPFLSLHFFKSLFCL